ncbi:hypothetical protein [Caudoviricetes sp.]|nr:hypothetical protein [Caudoviricetes sp.]
MLLSKNTMYGFEWGPAIVERWAKDEKKGSVLLRLTTKKHPKGMSILITKTGKIRVFCGGEWKLNKEGKNCK